MRVRFLQRNQVIEQVLPAGLEVSVASRENHIFGGPKACELEVKGDANDMLELLGRLRNRIEIFDDYGKPVWWGIVSRVEVPVNKVLMVSDLESMANAIKIVYTLTNASGESTGVSQETNWVIDRDSIEKYGRKEMVISIGESNAVAADVRARIELQERAFPHIFGTQRGSSSDVGRIEGIGEWETLGWQYASVPTKIALAFQTIGTGEYKLTAPEIKVAQSFKAATDFRLSDVSLFLSKVGAPGDLKVEVLEYVDEEMPGDVLHSVNIPAELVGTSNAWVRGALSEAYPMAAGERYFLALSTRWCDLDNYYSITLDGNHGYPEGTFRINVSSGWQADERDMPFRLNRNVQFMGHQTISELHRRIDSVTSGLAQQITLSVAKTISQVSAYLRRVGDPGDLTITLCEDDANEPGDKITTATIGALEVATYYKYLDALFEEVSTQSAGKYWLVMTASQADAINYYEFQLDGNQGYSGGIAMHKPTGAYVDGNADMPFKTQHNKLGASYTSTTTETLTLDNTQQAVAQTFQLTETGYVTRVKVYVRKTGSPADLTVAIVEMDEDGKPAGTSLTSGRIEALDIGTTSDWLTVEFGNFVQLTAYKQYALVMSVSTMPLESSYVLAVDGDGAYPGQTAWTKNSNNEWVGTSADIPFQTFTATDGASWGTTVNAARQIGGTYSAVAQQIMASATSELVGLSLQVRKVGEPGNLTVGLYSDSSGFPNKLLGSFSIDRRTIGSDYSWHKGWLGKQCAIVSGTRYWIRASANNADSSNYYEVGVDSGAGYGYGVLKMEQSGEWAVQSFDMPFRLFEPAVAHEWAVGSATAELGVDFPMIAQQVTAPSAIVLTSLALKLSKVGQPGNLSVDICTVENGFPGEVLGSATILSESVSVGTAAFVTGALQTPVELVGNESYFLLVKAAGTSEISFYNMVMDAGAGYSGGFALVKAGDVWAEGAGDMPFRLYSNDMVETSQQIQSLLTAYGQFFSRIYVDVSSGISAESFRGGDTDAKVEIEKMLDGGNLDNLRLLAKVNYDRTVEVLVQPEESAGAAAELRDDGFLWYQTGSKVEEAFDPTGKWVSLEPILRSAQFASVFTGSKNNFIETARWDSDGKLSATPEGWESNLARKVKISNG